tara:strand:+ start:454 stop:633 length:180 start_codon:yes stop_codon:yes gene_type:complete
MNIIVFILLFFLFSCNYPDIDSLPRFDLKKTYQEKCFYIGQIMIEDKDECKNAQIINRL